MPKLLEEVLLRRDDGLVPATMLPAKNYPNHPDPTALMKFDMLPVYVPFPPSQQKTPIQRLCHFAAKGEQEPVLQLLRSGTVDVNDSPWPDGRTALHYAANNGLEEMCTILLDAGALVDSERKDDKRTPLFLAAESGHVQIVKLLLNKGASASHADFWGARAWHNSRTDEIRSVLEEAERKERTKQKISGGKAPLLKGGEDEESASLPSTPTANSNANSIHNSLNISSLAMMSSGFVEVGAAAEEFATIGDGEEESESDAKAFTSGTARTPSKRSSTQGAGGLTAASMTTIGEAATTPEAKKKVVKEKKKAKK